MTIGKAHFSLGHQCRIMHSPTCVSLWHQLDAYSIENFSFGGLFFQDQICFSLRSTITSFLKEFSAMKHLNSVGLAKFFAKITDFVKMISEK